VIKVVSIEAVTFGIDESANFRHCLFAQLETAVVVFVRANVRKKVRIRMPFNANGANQPTCGSPSAIDVCVPAPECAVMRCVAILDPTWKPSEAVGALFSTVWKAISPVLSWVRG